jgi:hypothetical protein
MNIHCHQKRQAAAKEREAKPQRFKGAILKKSQPLQSPVRVRRVSASASFAASPLTLARFISVEMNQTESMSDPIGDLVDCPP